MGKKIHGKNSCGAHAVVNTLHTNAGMVVRETFIVVSQNTDNNFCHNILHGDTQYATNKLEALNDWQQDASELRRV